MSANGPPTGSRPHISASINSVAERSVGACGHSTQPAATAMPPAKAPASRSPFTAPSGAKRDAGAGCRQHQLVWRLRAHRLDEVVAAAVHRDVDVRIERLALGDDL